MNMDYDYAQKKLESLLNNLPAYTGAEFWRQMSRIAAGATGNDHAEETAKERDALAASSAQGEQEQKWREGRGYGPGGRRYTGD